MDAAHNLGSAEAGGWLPRTMTIFSNSLSLVSRIDSHHRSPVTYRLPLSTPQHRILKSLLSPGDSGVGKSSLLVRFADNHFSGNYITTIGSIKFLLITQRSQPSKFSTPNICRCGFQDPNNRDQRGASETPDMGHCWAGFLKSDFIFQLTKSNGKSCTTIFRSDSEQ